MKSWPPWLAWTRGIHSTDTTTKTRTNTLNTHIHTKDLYASTTAHYFTEPSENKWWKLKLKKIKIIIILQNSFVSRSRNSRPASLSNNTQGSLSKFPFIHSFIFRSQFILTCSGSVAKPGKTGCKSKLGIQHKCYLWPCVHARRWIGWIVLRYKWVCGCMCVRVCVCLSMVACNGLLFHPECTPATHPIFLD